VGAGGGATTGSGIVALHSPTPPALGVTLGSGVADAIVGIFRNMFAPAPEKYQDRVPAAKNPVKKTYTDRVPQEGEEVPDYTPNYNLPYSYAPFRNPYAPPVPQAPGGVADPNSVGWGRGLRMPPNPTTPPSSATPPNTAGFPGYQQQGEYYSGSDGSLHLPAGYNADGPETPDEQRFNPNNNETAGGAPPPSANENPVYGNSQPALPRNPYAQQVQDRIEAGPFGRFAGWLGSSSPSQGGGLWGGFDDIGGHGDISEMEARRREAEARRRAIAASIPALNPPSSPVTSIPQWAYPQYTQSWLV
jgi:hypothetical protein